MARRTDERPLFEVLRTAHTGMAVPDIDAILALPAQPRILSIANVLRLATWVVERARPITPRAPLDAELAEAKKQAGYGTYPFLVLGSAGKIVAAVSAGYPVGAERNDFVRAMRAEAARLEAEEVRDELGGRAPIARVVWSAQSELRKRAEAWVVRLDDGRWAAIARDRKRPSKRLWFEGERDDVLALIPDALFDAAATAARAEK